MDWKEILTILVPILGMMAWVYNRIDKKFEKVEERFDKVDRKLDDLNMRLTRLEGRFDERGYWEAREFHKTGTEGKK